MLGKPFLQSFGVGGGTVIRSIVFVKSNNGNLELAGTIQSKCKMLSGSANSETLSHVEFSSFKVRGCIPNLYNLS